MTTPRPTRPLIRTARRLALAFAMGFVTLGALADIVEPIDGEEIGGRFTFNQDAGATITNAQGDARSLPLIDINEVRMGQELAVVSDGNLLLINNDHADTEVSQSESIRLRAGLHHFVLPYWQGTGTRSLSLVVTGPGIEGTVALGSDHLRCFRRSETPIPESEGIDSEGYRLPEFALDQASDRRQFRDRANYQLFTGQNPQQYRGVGALSTMQLQYHGNTAEINASFVNNPVTGYGLIFEAFFIAPRDGEYTFTLRSNDGSQLYFGTVNQFQARDLGTVNEGPTPWTAKLNNNGTAAGDLINITDQQLTMNLPLGDEQSTPAQIGLSHVASLWHQSVEGRMIDRSDEPIDQDTVYLRNRDNPDQIQAVSGTILALSAEELSFRFRGEARVINRERIVGLVFKDAGRAHPENPGFYQSLSFRTGQSLPARLVSVDDRVVFELIGGSRIDAPREALSLLRCENGRRVDLTRIAPTAQEAIPYFGIPMPARIGTNFSGQQIYLFDHNRYDRAIAVHSRSRLYYRLDRPCERFRAVFGLMDPGGTQGNVTARVLGDGEVLWEQENITAQTGVIDVDVELQGIERIVLEVDFGEGQNVGDRAAWCNPQLIYESRAE